MQAGSDDGGALGLTNDNNNNTIHDGAVMAVAESPTAVDFSIYDRAYEAEVARIARKNDAAIYLTRFVGNKARFLGVDNMVMAGGGASVVSTPKLEPVEPATRVDDELVDLGEARAT
jgi:hypothetical protein